MRAEVKAIEAALELFPGAANVRQYGKARFALAECCTPERMRRLLDERREMVEALRELLDRCTSDRSINEFAWAVERAAAALARAEGGE